MAKKKSSTLRTTKPGKDNVDFETSLAEVEQIVARLEAGELGLTESLEQYESGIQHLKRCHKLLDAAQQRVSLLSGFDADGNPVTEPLREPDGGGNDDGKPAAAKTGSASTPKANQGSNDAVSGSRRGQDSVDDDPGLF